MTSRVQIARARARVAIAARTGEDLPDRVRRAAAMDFADADDALMNAETRDGHRSSTDSPLGQFVGVHACGRDFGQDHNSQRALTDPVLTPAEEQALIQTAFGTRARYEATKDAVARGALDAIEHRSVQCCLSYSLTLEETADWLGAGTARILTQLASGNLFAFVFNDDLRFPAWQFTEDPNSPVLDQLPALVKALDDLHPTSILGFMTTPHVYTSINGVPATPVEWLIGDHPVQPLLNLLESRRFR